MPASKNKKRSNNYVLVVLGVGMLVAGIVMVLTWWPDVIRLFRGFIGMAMAVAGLVVLYLIKE